MTKKKTVTRAAPRRAPVAPPPAISITQHIDARGLDGVSVSKLQGLLAEAADTFRADLARRLVGERGPEIISLKPRFTKVGSDTRALPADSTEWDGVYDATTGLIWGRRLLTGTREWADAVKAAGQTTLCGAPARAPTIQERLSIVDYSRVEPALDVSFFEPSEKEGWEWTSTPAAAPSGCAWGVYLGDGDSGRYYQGDRYRVRAVRAGQPLGI